MVTRKYVSLSKLGTFLDNLKKVFATKESVDLHNTSTDPHANMGWITSGDGELADTTLPESDIQFPTVHAGKFLIVGEDGNIAVSPVSVGSPIVVLSSENMNTILENATEADIGKCYLYKGETDALYESGALYIIEAEV